MLSANEGQIDKVLSRTDHIYNFCILAHVDHGKTTLCDHLISTNGIVSKALAGNVRYMDCLPAEQERSITMKTSAISLLCKRGGDLFYFNVVDSPGHGEFEAEVSNAVRLSDGCIILVDAIERVCVQTELVLRVAIREGLECTLVINKVDRLFMERDMTPESADFYLQQLLTEVNAATSLDEPPFDPAKGNVIFASCTGKWGLCVRSIASDFATKLQLPPDKCAEIFWGNHFYDPGTRRILTKPPIPSSCSLFAQGIMTPVYEAYREGGDVARLAKKLNVEGTFSHGAAVLARWRPLSATLIDLVLGSLQTPVQAQAKVLVSLCPPLTDPTMAALRRAAESVDRDAPVLAFAPKIVHGGLLCFPPRSPKYQFVAYVRVYCGVIRAGDSLFVGHSKSAEVKEIVIQHMYIFMSHELIPIARAPAGCVVGVGLTAPILKQSTLSSLQQVPHFRSVTHYTQPIVKVSLEALALRSEEHTSELQSPS
jgi:small GTP-binding protein